MRNALASAGFLSVLLSLAATVAADNYCGDVNGNGTITSSDALAVLKRGVGQDVGLTCGPPGEPVLTKEFNYYGPGSDGNLHNGSPRSFTDNGDGTVTDYATGLMWEKKDDLGGLHDKDNQYTWSAAGESMDGSILTNFLANMNAGGGFAGHNDWRIPNRFELETLLHLGTTNPSTHFRFNYYCSTGCSISNCSCTSLGSYWTSTTYASVHTYAWAVNFVSAGLSTYLKTNSYHARAVRNAPNLTTYPTCHAPDPPQCLYNDPCSEGTCSQSRAACGYASDCPLAPNEQCCCAGVCM